MFDYVASELLAPGEISFSSDPQLGKAVLVARDWITMCDRAAEYFKLRRPNLQGPPSTYAQTMYNLFTNPAFRNGEVASNETFKYIEIPEFPERLISSVLQDQVTPVLVGGYRAGEGVDPHRWPTDSVCDRVNAISSALSQAMPNRTVFSEYSIGKATYGDYIDSLRSQLADQGGAWVTVAPRDTTQQGMDSESAGITSVSKRNAEMWAQRSGCVGYEIGGAQYQTALIRGFDPAAVLTNGLPYNMPAHSLQRAQYVNGLVELPPTVRQPLFRATANLVRDHYNRRTKEEVPWFPYNFHAGNFVDAKGYSPQDLTTVQPHAQHTCTHTHTHTHTLKRNAYVHAHVYRVSCLQRTARRSRAGSSRRSSPWSSFPTGPNARSSSSLSMAGLCTSCASRTPARACIGPRRPSSITSVPFATCSGNAACPNLSFTSTTTISMAVGRT
jgi:hypothetical protein